VPGWPVAAVPQAAGRVARGVDVLVGVGLVVGVRIGVAGSGVGMEAGSVPVGIAIAGVGKLSNVRLGSGGNAGAIAVDTSCPLPAHATIQYDRRRQQLNTNRRKLTYLFGLPLIITSELVTVFRCMEPQPRHPYEDKVDQRWLKRRGVLAPTPY